MHSVTFVTSVARDMGMSTASSIDAIWEKLFFSSSTEAYFNHAVITARRLVLVGLKNEPMHGSGERANGYVFEKNSAYFLVYLMHCAHIYLCIKEKKKIHISLRLILIWNCTILHDILYINMHLRNVLIMHTYMHAQFAALITYLVVSWLNWRLNYVVCS